MRKQRLRGGTYPALVDETLIADGIIAEQEQMDAINGQ